MGVRVKTCGAVVGAGWHSQVRGTGWKSALPRGNRQRCLSGMLNPVGQGDVKPSGDFGNAFRTAAPSFQRQGSLEQPGTLGNPKFSPGNRRSAAALAAGCFAGCGTGGPVPIFRHENPSGMHVRSPCRVRASFVRAGGAGARFRRGRGALQRPRFRRTCSTIRMCARNSR